MSASISVAAEPGSDWDDFVRGQAGASIYLRSGWSLLARDVFRHRPHFIEARDSQGCLEGVLPVVQQRGLLGNFATSIPFFNYGGALAADAGVIAALMDRARVLASDLGCSYLELRDVAHHGGDWIERTDKASMILKLPGTADALARQLGSKLRSQIKRADRETLQVRKGGPELLDAFYDVFCRNMRDLGTPVYPLRFFRAILERFPENTQLLVVYHHERPAAAGFIVVDGTQAEIPWASCRSDAKPLGINMKLYWEALTLAIDRGCTAFDFGRSTIDGGTYKFKKQWGAEPLQLHWHRWERHPRVGADNSPSQGRFMKIATAVWQRLPLPIANLLGPRISPGLPW